MPRSVQRKVSQAVNEQQHQHDSSLDEWDDDENVEYPTVHHPVYIRESDEWEEHEHSTRGLDMVAGTFGRV
jgi:hypothetical protein